MNGFQKIISDIFEEHGFDRDFYKPWFLILGRVGSVELVAMVEFLQDSTTEELKFFTNNLHEKKEALQSGNIKSWKRLIQRQREHVKEA